jgi:uncharacterized MAPEG superfamily protein
VRAGGAAGAVFPVAGYIADRPMLRSHAWRLGLVCVIGLFVVAALHGRG